MLIYWTKSIYVKEDEIVRVKVAPAGSKEKDVKTRKRMIFNLGMKNICLREKE